MTNVYDHENPAVADIRAEEAANEALLFTRKQCMARGGWGQTSQISKENSGALHQLLDGSAVRITAKSFYAHLIDLASAPARQGRKASRTSFKARRAPTPQELAALQRANDVRHEEKVARKRQEESRA